jgi:DNA (cytosine-5)-methyltransferase 3A
LRNHYGYETINVLSLFDGISCGKLALEKSGIKVDNYYSSEIDENAITISSNNHQDIIRMGSVEEFDKWDLPKIDLVIGGSPCQGFSRNGKGLNFNDPRSRLFFTYVDILNNIKSKNSNVYYLLENVQMKKEWVNTISGYLNVNPIEINSKLVSAQYRLRTYWFNWEAKLPKEKNISLISILDNVDTSDYIEYCGILFDPLISEQSRNLVSVVDGEVRIKQAVKKGYIVAEDGDGINLSFPTSNTRRGRVIKQKSPTLDCACNICVLRNGVIRFFTMSELEKLQTLPVGYTKTVGDTLAKKAIGNGWNVDTVAEILKQMPLK